MAPMMMMQNAKCKMQNAQRKMHNAKCKMQNALYRSVDPKRYVKSNQCWVAVSVLGGRFSVGEPKGTQRNPKEPKGTQRNPEEPIGTHRNP